MLVSISFAHKAHHFNSNHYADSKEKKGRGRPKGSPNKIGKDEKDFIRDLLTEARPMYKENFLKMGNSKDPKERAKFMDHADALRKLIVAPPKELKVKTDEEDFNKLKELFGKWDDEEEDDDSE